MIIFLRILRIFARH